MKFAKRKADSKPRLVPIGEVRVIMGDYVEALAEYLASNEWRTAEKRAFVVLRNDEGTLYVFDRKNFLALAEKAKYIVQLIRTSGTNLHLLGELADIFNIHENTRNEVIQPTELPSGMTAAVYAGTLYSGELYAGEKWDPARLHGVWIPPEKRHAISPRQQRNQQEDQKREQQQQQAETKISEGLRQSSLKKIREFKVYKDAEGGAPRRVGGGDKGIGGDVGRSVGHDRGGRIVPAAPAADFAHHEKISAKPVTRRKQPAAARPSSTPAVAGRPGARKVEEQTLRRTPHMKLSTEDPVSHGDQFDVSIYVDEKAALADEVTQNVVIKAPLSVREFPVTVFLSTTDDFEIRGAESQELVIKRDETKSPEVKFSVVVVADPASMHAATVVAAFDYKGRPCGKVTRSVIVGPRTAAKEDAKPKSRPSKAPQSDSSTGQPRVELVANARPADMTITILNPSRDKMIFDVIVKTPLLASYKKGVKKKWVLPAISSDVVKGYFQEFIQDNNTNRQLRAALNGAGKHLFETSPPHFQKALWQIIDDHLPLRTISIVSEEPFIPWELMIPKRSKDDAHSALGATYSVGRWVCDDNVSPGQVLTLKECRVVAPVYNGEEVEGQVVNPLPHANEEADFVLSRFAGHRIEPALYDTFDTDMEADGAPLLHFVCHGAEQTAVAQRMHFEQSQIVSSLQISGSEAVGEACKKHKPLVFLNACEVGRLQPALVGVGGFAQAFISQGANAVIAPLWSVKDDIAHLVAKDFYNAIAKSPDRPFAEIIRDIRAKAYDESAVVEDTYAAYCFYGDPLAYRAA